MTAPMIVAGVTGTDRIFCQFWGEWKFTATDIRTVDFAVIASDEGLRISADCPADWRPQIWAAFLLVVSGVVPAATHTVVYSQYGNRTFTAAHELP